MNNLNIQLIHGSCFEYLKHLEPNSIDALITDPPYCSGGSLERTPTQKYQNGGTIRQYPDFDHDAKDQRSFISWSAEWLSLCYKAMRPGAYFLVFIDWRNHPCLCDAVQWAGFTRRGNVVWDKSDGARAPHKGYFRHQCEYAIWGTKGHLNKPNSDNHPGPFPGCFRITVKQSDKFHVTGKPTELMRELVKVVPEYSTILDPFAGSGTTAVACVHEKRHFVGHEVSKEYHDIAQIRISEAFKDGLQQAA